MCDMIECGAVSTKPLPKVSTVERRNFLKGAVALPLATVLAYPELAEAAASGLAPLSLETPSGAKATGFVALPAKTPAPAVLLIHEWWGLNAQIKSVAAEFAKLGYIAVAIDLYDGKVATTRENARSYMKSVDAKVATERLATVVGWLRKHEKGTGKVGTIGWCFGGGWSLNASVAAPVDATVIYYGRVTNPASELKALSGPVLGHFATKDKWINGKMVGGFEAAMKTAGKTDLTVSWYVAQHAFANPTSARYDEEDAELAWTRTLAFYQKHLW